MLIIGCDYHPSWQQVCWMETSTGETQEKKLEHGSGEAERFYRQLAGPALIGMEATGNCQWFVELAKRLGHELNQHSISGGRSCREQLAGALGQRQPALGRQARPTC